MALSPKYWVKTKCVVGAAFSDGSFEIELPTGCWLFRSVIKPVGTIIIREIFMCLPKVHKRISVLTGNIPDFEYLKEPNITVIPYLDTHEEGLAGWNLTAHREGDVKLGFTIDLPAPVHVQLGQFSGYGGIILHHEVAGLIKS